MPLLTGKYKQAFGVTRRFFLSSIIAATCLMSAAVPASADAIAEADPSLGNYWPKFDGVYIRLKDGGLIEVPKLEQMTWDKDADVFYVFSINDAAIRKADTSRHRDKSTTSGIVLDPKAVEAQVPVVDGNQIEAFIFQNATSFDRLSTIHRIGDYLNDRKGQNWSPTKRYRPLGKQPKGIGLPSDWPSLLIHSNWGHDDNHFRREQGPNGAIAYHLGNEDITGWINGRWMSGGWKQGDPRDVRVRAFVLESGRGRFLHRIFRIVQQPMN